MTVIIEVDFHGDIMFDLIYKKLYILGLFTARYVTGFFEWLGKLVMKPVKALSAVLFAAFVVVDKLVLSSARHINSEIKELFGDIKRVFGKLVSLFKQDRNEAAVTFKTYVKKAFQRHGIVFSFFTNIVTPVVALVILIATIRYWSSMNLALKITYNNADIGYVGSESVYLDAEDKATERLKTAIAANDGEALIKSAQYKIVPVKLNNMKDSEAICDKIIEYSNKNITNACRIYIDGEFLCAVKNETDATTVFDNILTSYDAGDSNAIVSFVENIEYVQGLYPDDDNTVWGADRLSEKLNSKKSEAVYYTVASGDTVSGIAQKYGISTAKLFELNPGLNEKIHVGDRVLISSEVNFVRVQVTKTEVRTVSIPYNTVKVENPSMYKGTSKTVTKGQNGEQQITELVTYIDGVRVSSKEVSRVTTKEAVDEKIQVGTKTYSSGYGSIKNYGTVQSYGGKFVWPAIGAYSVSSGFGYRHGRLHGGIDIVKPGGNSTGCPVVAAASGTVVSAGYHPSWGYNVLINHGNGLQTRYAHMIRGSLKVSAGQRVSAGQQLGNIGSTGNVTGPHLHFEVYVNGTRVNPSGYLGR